MNIQAHAVLTVAALGRDDDEPRHTAALLLGSVLPDLQIVAFYVVEKLLYGTPEAEIWGMQGRYAEVHHAFDWLNSIPLSAAVALVAWQVRARTAFCVAAGVLVHCVMDLLTHNDDNHRHFLPLSDFRFESPVSYWDPSHYGVQFTIVELVLVAAAIVLLRRRHPGRLAASLMGLALSVYGLFILLAVLWLLGVFG